MSTCTFHCFGLVWKIVNVLYCFSFLWQDDGEEQEERENLLKPEKTSRFSFKLLFLSMSSEVFVSCGPQTDHSVRCQIQPPPYHTTQKRTRLCSASASHEECMFVLFYLLYFLTKRDLPQSYHVAGTMHIHL